MIIVHCVIHRENLVWQNIFAVFNEVLKSVMKCISAIKANVKCECLSEQFCDYRNADNVIVMFHTDVGCRVRGIFWKGLLELFDILSDFLCDEPVVEHLLTADGKAFVSYLVDISMKNNCWEHIELLLIQWLRYLASLHL